MDYICLFITSKILRHKTNALRFIIASALGGVYSAVSLFFNINPIHAFILDLLICIIMVMICFISKGTKKQHVIPKALLFTGISMLLGGIMTAIFNLLNKLNLNLWSIGTDGADTYTFAIIAVISAIISIKGISFITKRNKHREYDVHFTVNGKEKSLLGFIDTGNLAHEQISGKSIIFVDKLAVSDIIASDAKEKLLSGEIIYKSSRLVPISTANGDSLLFAFAPDKIELKEKSHKDTSAFLVDCFIAVTDLNANGKYGAIIPEDIIKLS